MFLSPVRYLVGKFAPQPGEGLSVEAQINGSFSTVTVVSQIQSDNQEKMLIYLTSNFRQNLSTRN